MPKNIGFVSTRFAGMDGVSLESAKWAEALWEDGHVSFWYSGFSDRQDEIARIIPEAFFGYPENVWINERIWGTLRRDPLVSRRIQASANYLKKTLYDFVEDFNIDILIPQNILAIPMHIPLGLAVTEFLAETNMPAIAHHHDFTWERTRFAVSSVQDYLNTAFPPDFPNLRHVVINKAAEQQLSYRKGTPSLLIPNVFNFHEPAPQPDAYSSDIREAIGLNPEDKMILQPTRIVPRKGIEHSIKLVGRLNDPRYKLVVSHEAGDEGHGYKQMLQELAHEENVDIRFIDHQISDVRQLDANGNKMYTLWDLYPFADFVTYPSTYEGFGNALLEAIYFRIPVLVNRYSIFIQDIEPKGFKFSVMDGMLTKTTVDDVKHILEDDNYRNEVIEHNYAVAQKYYSYEVLRRNLRTLMTSLSLS